MDTRVRMTGQPRQTMAYTPGTEVYKYKLVRLIYTRIPNTGTFFEGLVLQSLENNSLIYLNRDNSTDFLRVKMDIGNRDYFKYCSAEAIVTSDQCKDYFIGKSHYIVSANAKVAPKNLNTYLKENHIVKKRTSTTMALKLAAITLI